MVEWVSANINNTDEKTIGHAHTQGHSRALTGSGVNIHIFMFHPTNFFSNKLFLRFILKDIRRAEHEV